MRRAVLFLRVKVVFDVDIDIFGMRYARDVDT